MMLQFAEMQGRLHKAAEAASAGGRKYRQACKRWFALISARRIIKRRLG